MKSLTWCLLVLLTAAPLLAKPKVDVRVKVNEGIIKNRAGDSLSKGGSTPANTFTVTVWFLNVTMRLMTPRLLRKTMGNGASDEMPRSMWRSILRANIRARWMDRRSG
jgi:hypothetical protein